MNNQKAEERTTTENTARESILAELRQLCIIEKEDRAEYIRLEQLCDTFELDKITQLINRRNDVFD